MFLPAPCSKPPPSGVKIRPSSTIIKKPPKQGGFFIIGGVVNLNGIKHTKSKTLQSQITGNLQGILSCFSPLIPSCLP